GESRRRLRFVRARPHARRQATPTAFRARTIAARRPCSYASVDETSAAVPADRARETPSVGDRSESSSTRSAAASRSLYWTVTLSARRHGRSRRLSFSTSVVRLRLRSFAACPLFPPVRSSDR